jgi:transposase InsO family protein
MPAWWSPAVRLRPGWTVRIVLPLTLAYLVVEFAFNGRLLDVTGGMAAPDEIGMIEHIGRALSGIALALVFWKAIIRRAERRGLGLVAFLGLLLVSGLLSMAMMYAVQKGLIDYLVDRSTGTERRTAIRIRLMTTSIIEQDAAIEGIELTPAVMASPEGKSFLSLLPIMTFLHGDTDGSVTGMLRQLARLRLEAAIGTAESSYTNVFVPSAEAIVDSYNAYADGVNRYRQALLAIPARQATAWADYENELRRHGWTPGRVPAAFRDQVRDEISARANLDLPAGWNPSDRAAFDAAIAGRIVDEADDAYEQAMVGALGVVLPKNLDIDRFEAEPAIQEKWRRAIGLAEPVRLAHRMGLAAYVADVYEPAINRRLDAEMRALTEADDKFADRGPYGQIGRDAVAALYVPPLALFFSFLGALIHMIKASRMSALILLPGLQPRRLTFAVAAAFIGVAAGFLLIPNAVSRSQAFTTLERQMMLHSPAGRIAAPAVRLIVQIEPYFYPINDFMRRGPLLGASFGYHPAYW